MMQQPALQDQVDAYLSELSLQRRLSPHTVSNYQRDLEKLIRYCQQKNISSWQALTEEDVRLFLGRLHQQGSSPSSIQRHLSAIRSFYQFLLEQKLTGINPAKHVRAPKNKKHLPDTLDVDRTQAFLNAIPTDSPTSIRDKAIFELFYSSGLRLSELTSLNMSNIKLDDKLVEVLQGKGGKDRTVPLGEQAISAIRNWLGQRDNFNRHQSDALFLSQKHQRITPRTVQSRLAYWARKLGVGQHIHPHMLRHSLASHVLESSHDLRGVQELLGHANLSTTQIYTHLDFQHLANIYDKAHPRAKTKK